MKSPNLKSICIFTQSPLVAAPRVVKEANVYAAAGYKVTLFALWYNKGILEKDRALLHNDIVYKAGVDLLNFGSLGSKYIRLNRKIARVLVKYLGIGTVAALGYDFTAYLEKLLMVHADLYIGHEEMSMALAKCLIKRKKIVAFDFEDWHSRDLLPEDRKARPLVLLEDLEAYVLKYAKYTYTTSQVMSDTLAQTYKCAAPQVIYNSFPAAQRDNLDGKYKDRKDLNLPSLYWFSQVISEGRGLELLFEALQHTTTALQLHLRGRIEESYRNTLITLLPKHVKLHIHDVVPPQELISRIAEHDIGIAFEENTPKSRDFTITNKVFHYLQAGIAVLATATQGQAEVKAVTGEAVIMLERHPQQIARAIEVLFENPNTLKQAKAASWEAGGGVFAYEQEKRKLLEFVRNLKS